MTDTLTPELATALMALRADAEVEARIDELHRKEIEGAFAPAEDSEYRDFIEAVDVVSILTSEGPEVCFQDKLPELEQRTREVVRSRAGTLVNIAGCLSLPRPKSSFTRNTFFWGFQCTPAIDRSA